MAKKRSATVSRDTTRRNKAALQIQELIAMRRVRRGSSDAEFSALIARKLGITEEESARAAKRSVAHLRATKRAFDERLRTSRWNPDRVFKLLSDRDGLGGYWQPQSFGSDVGRIPTEGGPWRYKAIDVQGLGSRLLTSTVSQAVIAGAFLFRFAPSVTGDYDFSIPLIIVGPKFVAADDGLCEDKYAQLDVKYDVRIDREYTPTLTIQVGGVSGVGLVADRIENGSIEDTVIWSGRIEAKASLVAGAATTIVLSVYFLAKAAGSGSVAQLLCGQGKGGLYCPWAGYSGDGIAYP